jgi:molecular chaperone GrpE
MKQKEDLNSDIENNDETTQENPMEESVNADSEVVDKAVEKEAELAALNDKYLRLYSEFENYKKRSLKDRQDQSRMAAADVFLSFIPIIDDLERALKSAEDAKDLKSVKEGISLIYSKVKNMTASKGLKPMEATGKPFDADLHDAVANITVDDESKKGKVIEEVEKGYFLNDKVIRYAKVIVGQ